MTSYPPSEFPSLPPKVELAVLRAAQSPGLPVRLAEDLVATIITFNRVDGLRRLVASLTDQSILPALVITVDNGRRPETADQLDPLLARGCEVVIITPARNVGPAGATALAMTLALETAPSDSSWFTILNDDLIFPMPTLIEEMLIFGRNVFSDDPDVAAVGRIGHRFDRAWGRLRRPPEIDEPNVPTLIDVDYLTTGSAHDDTGQPVPMFRLSAVRNAGPFWADLFIGMTEVEFGLRLRQRGYRVVANGSLWRPGGSKSPPNAWKYVSAPVARSPTRRYYSARNLVVISRIYGHWWTAGWVTISRLGAAALRLLGRPSLVMLTHLHATLAGIADGWRSRLGERNG